MITKDKVWIALMKFFAPTCHQRSDRSFFLGNYQFPLCARCTGMVLGYIISILTLIKIRSIPISISIVFLAIMFLDWLIQFLGLLNSTNTRRLITGILGGYAVVGILFNILSYFIKLLFK
ncbi:DUF2085 domain-containing protein [Clostridium sp. YIM B02551]|uniref:DUF2085 domain-containing protein n=1 Tax=Clostridium sp. YIM B02551 TaxID=2910679 RepID=UPI001EEB93AE|nr:DUF2085 domain-containing protein [Clostridium sp. YIM B02551]